MEIAVTSTGMSSLSMDPSLVDLALRKARIVLADCNLSEDQLGLIVDTANRLGKPVLLAGVSDSKVTRVLDLPKRLAIDVFSLNEFWHPQGQLTAPAHRILGDAMADAVAEPPSLGC